MDGALRQFLAEMRPRLTGSHCRLDRDLEVLLIGGPALVDDDEVDAKPLHAPVFVGSQKLADLIDVVDVVDPADDDRPIAGNAVRP